MDHQDLLIAASIFTTLFLPMFAVFIAISGGQWRAEQEKARERRMAEHRMNARLLRFNI